jgi:mannose-6-phosphate isomerase
VTTPAPYPLLFEPVLLPKVWGGDRLAKFGKAVSPGDRIGESWELADLAATSASGAGGAGVRSVIANGPLKGRTLHDAMDLWGERLLGDAKPIDGGFPLLVKLLDARENLSVQVHPSAAYAAAHAGAKLKTECWYILEAQPGSVIYKGVKPGVTRETFAQHIADATVLNDLVSVPAVVGECHNLPSGTVHALGAGVVVAEVQTPSDTTFRVFDWGRKGRALHISECLECMDLGPPPPALRLSKGDVLTTEFFTVSQPEPGKTVRPRSRAATVIMPLVGWGHMFWPGQPAITEVDQGQTILVPADIATSFEFVPAGMGAHRVLVARL